MFYKSKNLSLKTNKKAPPRAHFVVSKKVSPTAVKRNLLKKRARMILSSFLKKRKPKSSLIFYFKKSSNTLPFSSLKTEILELLKKAKI